MMLTGNPTADDAVGNLTRISEPDPDGGANPLQPSVTYQQFDALDRLVATIDPREGVTRFGYDAVGNQTSLTDPVQNTTTFAVDRLNRLVAETNSLNKTRSYEYDAAGNLTMETDRRGKIRQFGCDNLNRFKEEKWYDGMALVRTITFGRDLADQLTSASDPAATYSYAYDKRGNVELVTAELAGLGSSKKIFLRQTYDHLSRRDTSKAAIGSTEAGATKDYLTDYTFDAISRLTKVTQDGQSGGNQVAEKRVDLAYNAVGQFTSIARYKDLDGGATNEVATTEFLYDALGRLTDLDHKDAGVVLTGYNLTYDNQNRLTRQEFTNYSAETADFKYDAADQLTSADRTGTTSDESYVNDLNGNRRIVGRQIIVQPKSESPQRLDGACGRGGLSRDRFEFWTNQGHLRSERARRTRSSDGTRRATPPSARNASATRSAARGRPDRPA